MPQLWGGARDRQGVDRPSSFVSSGRILVHDTHPPVFAVTQDLRPRDVRGGEVETVATVKSSKPANLVLLASSAWLLVGLTLSLFSGGCRHPEVRPTTSQRVSGQADTVPLVETATLSPECPSPTTSSDAVPIALPSDLPVRDLAELARRLCASSDDGVVASESAILRYAEGVQESFWISDQRGHGHRLITATLACVTPHLHMWVEEGVHVSLDDLRRSAQEFDERTYPANRRYFGAERSPGIDGDSHVSVLNGRFEGASGYFSCADGYSRSAHRYSNEREMFYINVDAVRPGTIAYQSTLAHEFQHLIHWHADANEDAWVNEGASELATSLNGYKQNGRIAAFARTPDTQLNAWGDRPDNSYEHYGASHLMMLYFYERFGDDALRELIAHPDKGMAGFDSILAQHGNGDTFEDLFADWVICNALDGASLGEKHGYRTLSDDLRIDVENRFHRYPVTESHSVHQFGTDYFELLPDGSDAALTVEFDGAATVSLVGNRPHGGRYQWWSNRGDLSDTKLTHSFDLSDLGEATLEYALWYDIEDGWDYAYVEVSSDGGRNWHILRGQHSSDSNPNGYSYGWAYTGISGKGKTPRWLREQVDLTPYAGQHIEVRFEYVTDDAINRQGLCLDDIAIPELGYLGDAESDAGGWRAEGFVRTDNTLAQRYLVQVIEIGGDDGGVEVYRAPLTEDNRGRTIIEGLGSRIDRAVLAISGLTRFTTELAAYELRVHP